VEIRSKNQSKKTHLKGMRHFKLMENQRRRNAGGGTKLLNNMMIAVKMSLDTLDSVVDIDALKARPNLGPSGSLC